MERRNVPTSPRAFQPRRPSGRAGSVGARGGLTPTPPKSDGTVMKRAHEYGYWYYLRPPSPGAGVFARD